MMLMRSVFGGRQNATKEINGRAFESISGFHLRTISRKRRRKEQGPNDEGDTLVNSALRSLSIYFASHLRKVSLVYHLFIGLISVEDDSLFGCFGSSLLPLLPLIPDSTSAALSCVHVIF